MIGEHLVADKDRVCPRARNASPGEQRYIRQRACVYFSLWELTGRKPRETKTEWYRIRGYVDDDQPWRVLELSSYAPDPAEAMAMYQKIAKRVENHSKGMTVVEKGHQPYPRLLAELGDGPEFLFLRGRIELLETLGFSVVGTRQPSVDGARRAFKIAYLLAVRGMTVVSGLAMGIDEQAHRGALAVGANTIAVLGTPLDRVYPSEHENLQRLIGEAGLLVSQFCPGSGVQRFNFPARNATMSGLSVGTIVVEASETSGALIQARHCLKQGRKLFIPRSAIEDRRLSWPRNYMAKGAIKFDGIDDVVGQVETFVDEMSSTNATAGILGPCLRK